MPPTGRIGSVGIIAQNKTPSRSPARGRFSPKRARLQTLVFEEPEEVGDAAGVAPFVVVPRNDLDETPQADGVHRAENGRVRVAFQVGGNQGFIAVLDNA